MPEMVRRAWMSRGSAPDRRLAPDRRPHCPSPIAALTACCVLALAVAAVGGGAEASVARVVQELERYRAFQPMKPTDLFQPTW